MAAAGCDRSVRVVITNPSADIRAVAVEFAAAIGATPAMTTGENGELEITVRHADDIAGPLMSAFVNGGAAISQLEALAPTLEDAVLRLAEQTKRPARPEAARA
jgi:ABC-2 type transport system ATP-binding protein